MEKNGIVDAGSMFTVDPEFGGFSREEDIISFDKKEKNVVDDNSVVDDPSKNDINKEGDNNVDDNVNTKEGSQDDVNKEGLVDDLLKKNTINYRSIVDTLNNKGVIDLTNSVFTNEEGEELTIDSIDLSNEDNFCDFIATIINSQKEELMQDKIDVNSISDFTKKLIEAEKSGANILDILKEYDRTSAPVEKWDVDNKSDQLKIIRHYVSLLDLPKEDADEYYNSIISKGDDFIEARAMKYKSELKKRMDTIIEDRRRKAEEKKAKDLEDLKKMKKELRTSLSQKYQLNDNMLNKALNLRFSTSDKEPGVPLVIEKTRQMLMNPEEAPDLIMFLMNPEEFIKQKSIKKVRDEKIKTYKMVTTSNKNRNVSPIDNKGNEKTGIKIDEIELTNDLI